MEDYYEYLDSNGVTTLYKLIKDDTVALIDSYSVTINGITTTLDTHINDSDIHTPISDIENMVDTKISGLVNSAPETLDTLKELSDALGNDPNFATTVANQIGTKADKDSVYTKQETNTLLEGKANSVHSHVVSDISDFPTIPTKLSQLENDMGFGSGSGGVITSVSWSDITNKPNFATVATSGSYNDLSNKPTIPNVYNKTLTIQKNGTNVATFTSNSNTDVTADITVPTKVSELSNDSGFITGISWDKVTNKPTLATVATSGSYTDLSNTPTIPTKVSQLENDTGFINALTDVVDTKSNQTINGTKTFTKQLYLGAGGGSYGLISAKDNNSILRLFGGTAPSNGANLDLYGEGLSDGGFSLRARTSDKIVGLDGKIDGTLKWNGKNVAIDENLVHKSGDETIGGTKTFTSGPWVTNNHNTTGYSIKNIALARNDIPTEYQHYTFRAYDKNNNIMGEYCIEKTIYGEAVLNMGVRSEDSSGTQIAYGMQFRMTNDGSVARLIPSANNKVHLGDVNAKWLKVHSDDVVHTSGNESINGYKFFNNILSCNDNLILRNKQIDLKTTPTSNLFAHCIIQDKNDKTVAYLQYGQKTNGIDDIGLYLKNKSEQLLGIQLNTNKEFVPLGNNSYSLGSSDLKWANVYSTNDITNKVITYSVTSHNNTSSMTVSGGSSWDTGSTLFLYGNSHSNYPGVFNLTAKNTTNESKLIGFPNGTLTWGGKNIAIDENLVHRSGNETINGVKYFNNLVYLHDNMSNKNSRMDLFTTPANTLYAHYVFVDKNDEVCAYMQYGQQNSGTDFIGLFIHDKNRALHGIQVTTNKEVRPIANNTYNLGSSTNKWANVYATTFNGNLKGTIDSTTTATTQATTDNSTKIATTAWVRSYVNSVVGSGSVGASISAYYSNATTVTATGDTTGNPGLYPSDYSDYINIAPTVGTIYTGSQLFSSFTPTASGTINKVTTGPSSVVYQTTASAKATFSGAFTSSAKYLCTTANAVKFRAYVAQGTPAAMGSASVVDQSSAKSIFLRIQ